MTPPPPLSLARIATRIVLVSLVLVALLPPALWFGAGLAYERGRAQAAAATLASLDDGEPAAAESRLRRERAARHAGLPADLRVTWLRPGAADADTAALPAWPSVSAQAVAASGRGTVRVDRPLRPLLVQTLWIGLVSATLALAGWLFGVQRAVALMTRAESRIRALASLDPLTGLLNRDGLRHRLQRALARQRDGGHAVGVLLIDLDRFGLINETLGQASGDDLLRAVADRIRGVTRAGDGLARLGGDQFAVHVDTGAGRQALIAMANNLQRAFLAPFQLDGREVVATCSIGVALAGAPGGHVDALLQHAALALRNAKKLGGNRIAHREAADDDAAGSTQRLETEQRLHGALGTGQFHVVYQPIVEAASQRIAAVEALLRWTDPERGVVSPAEFIPALERTGLIVPVGRWVLREACRQIARWPGCGADGAPIGVSVNLSPIQFADPDVVLMVESVLRETGVAAERLQLEVTEGLLLEPTPEALRKIDGLVRLGVKLAVDDFGMGYSSLAYLKRFRLHALKIDRMFVRDIAERAQDLTIVRAIIDLGHGLGMRVTAEGVETRAQADALRALGCDALQGYLYGRPADAQALIGAADAAAEPAMTCA